MVNTNNLKRGLVVKLDDSLYEILEQNHYKPGKGQAFVRVKLKDIYSGSIIDKKLRSGEKIEDVFVDKRKMIFSYIDADQYVFMDSETYEQESISKTQLADNIDYLTENLEVLVKIYEGNVVGVDLPAHVTLEVTYTEPGVKGDTATTANKPITLETGLTVQAPLFINIGDKVRIDTRTREYVERA
jgi:elongation factor P